MGKPKTLAVTRGLKRHRAARSDELKKKKLKSRDLNGNRADASAPAVSTSGSLDEEPPENVVVLDGSAALGSLLKKLSPGLCNKPREQDVDGRNEQRNQNSVVLEQSEEDDLEDEHDLFNGDDVHDMHNNGNDALDEMTTSSSFHQHVGHILTSEAVDELMKQKSKYKWEIPAVDIPKSKWVGTGEEIQGTCRDHLLDIKGKLNDHWQTIYKSCLSAQLNSSRLRFFSLCNSYCDIMHCNKKPFYLNGREDSSIMDAYIMHALNHVYKTRDFVIKNDARLAKREVNEDILNEDTYRDQGFVRPKVLFLLPLRSIALRVVKRVLQLAPLSNRANVAHMDRFREEFGHGDTDDEQEEEQISEVKNHSKPADFQLLFGGNSDDHFLLGIKFTKRSIKLYNDFYSSDIIVASPLGLVTKIDEAKEEKEKDVDYLSSIEIAVIDHADVIAMQNWSHVRTVFEQLNCVPSKQHGTDMMRIRPWYLDGHARFYRQTILLGSYLNPEMNALFTRLCLNYNGKIKLVSTYKGVLPKILLQVRQVYERFDASSIVNADDARFECFCNKVYPKIRDSMERGVLVFISCYLEFVRIRNFLKSKDASFCLLGEYTKQSDISRSRLRFFEGKKKIMLYTERAHFYHRYKIRGTEHLIIYSLPERKDFYPEIMNMLDGSKNMICNVLFSRFDYLRLERIVGTSAAKRMTTADKNMFVFCH